MQDTHMANRLAGITIDCADPARLASFWSALLDIAVTAEHGDDAGWATVGSRLDHQPRLTSEVVGLPPGDLIKQVRFGPAVEGCCGQHCVLELLVLSAAEGALGQEPLA